MVDTGLLSEPVPIRIPAVHCGEISAFMPSRARMRNWLVRSSRVLSSGGRLVLLFGLTSYGPLLLSLAKSTISLLLLSE
ncbi:hypothetical protein D3C87_1257200 [compost metagenome]